MVNSAILKKQTGYSLLQVMLVAGSIAVAMTYSIHHHRQENEQARAKGLGLEIAQYNNAVRAYIGENAQQIVQGVKSEISMDDLKKLGCGSGRAIYNYLPCDFPEATTFGQLEFGQNGKTTFSVIPSDGLRPKIIAATKFDDLTIANKIRPDLAGLASMAAMGYALPNKTAQKLIAGGVKSSHADINVQAGTAQIQITSSNHLNSDQWLMTDGYNDMNADIHFDTTYDESEREIIGMSRAKNLDDSSLYLGDQSISSNVWVESNLKVSADSTPTMANPGQIILASQGIMDHISGQAMSYTTNMGNIDIKADDAFSNSSQNIAITTETGDLIATAKHNILFGSSTMGNVSLTSNTNNILLESKSDSIDLFAQGSHNSLNAGNDFLLKTGVDFSAQADQNIQYSAAQSLNITADTAAVTAKNMLSIISTDLLLTVAQQLLMQAGNNILWNAEHQIAAMASQAINIHSARNILLKDTLDIDNINLQADTGRLEAGNAMQYTVNNDIIIESQQGNIHLEAGNRLHLRATNFDADLNHGISTDVNAGNLSLYGDNGVNLTAQGDNEIYANQVLISAGMGHAGNNYETDLNLVSNAKIETTSDDYYTAQAQSLDMRARDMVFEQETSLQVTTDKDLSIQSEQLDFYSAKDLAIKAGNNAGTQGEAVRFYADRVPMNAYGVNESITHSKQNFYMQSYALTEVKAENRFEVTANTISGIYTQGEILLNSPQISLESRELGLTGNDRLEILNDEINLDTQYLSLDAENNIHLLAQNQIYNVTDFHIKSANIHFEAANDIIVNVDQPILLNNVGIAFFSEEYFNFESENAGATVEVIANGDSDITINATASTFGNYFKENVIDDIDFIGNTDEYLTDNILLEAHTMTFESDDIDINTNNLNADAAFTTFTDSHEMTITATEDIEVNADLSFNINGDGQQLRVEAKNLYAASDNGVFIHMMEGNLNDMGVDDCTYDNNLCAGGLAAELDRFFETMDNSESLVAETNDYAQQTQALANDSIEVYHSLAAEEQAALNKAQDAKASAQAAYSARWAAHRESWYECGGYVCTGNDPETGACTSETYVQRDCYYISAPAPLPSPDMPDESQFTEQDYPAMPEKLILQ